MCERLSFNIKVTLIVTSIRISLSLTRLIVDEEKSSRRPVVVAVLVTLCLLQLLFQSCEAKQRGGKSRKARQQRKGKSRGSAKTKPFYVCPTSCHLHKGKPCFGLDTDVAAGKGPVEDSYSLSDVTDSMHTTVDLLRELNSSITGISLVINNTERGHNPDFLIKELYPTTKTRLSSDGDFKLLGQMTWLCNWIAATFKVLEHADMVPSVRDPNTGVETNLPSIQRLVQRLQSSLAVNRHHLNYREGKKSKKGKKVKSPLTCQRVKVTSVCDGKKDKKCSKQRERTIVILRDSGRAVEKMLVMLEKVQVQEGPGGGFTLAGQLMNKSLFYHRECQKKACDLQKPKNRCKQCLRWEYV